MGRYAFLLWVALAGALVFQAVRTAQLEKRIDRATAAAAVESKSGAAVEAIAADVAKLSERVSALESAGRPSAAAGGGTQPGGASAVAPEKAREILSLVDQENRRKLEKHLTYQRERLIEHRQTALDDFTERYALTPVQQQRVHRLLLAESNVFYEIIGKPGSSEDPEQTGMELIAVLEETDRKVAAVLDPKQNEGWMQARAFERAVFMPWLPKY